MAVLGLCKKRCLKTAKINDYRILVDLKDGIGKQIWGLGRYEKRYTDVLKKVVKKDWICVDVGANIGYYSLLLAKLGCIVYAIEPNKNLCNMIGVSSYLNGYDIEIINSAADKEYGVKTFYFGEDSGFSSLKKIDAVREEEVEVFKLDDRFDKIDFIKIDAEGTARDVLKGMKNLLKKGIKIMQIEIRLDDEIVSFLEELGYAGYRLKSKGVFEKISKPYPNEDFYFVNKDYEALF